MYTVGTLKKEKCTFVLEVAFRAPYLIGTYLYLYDTPYGTGTHNR